MKDSTSITDEKMLYINNKHFNIEQLVKIADVLEVDLTDFFL